MLAEPLGDIGAGDEIADAQSRQSVDLGKGAGDDDVLPFAHQVDHRRIIGRGNEIEIGLIDEGQGPLGNAFAEILQFGAGKQRAGGIVRVADVDHARARRDAAVHLFEVVTERLLDGDPVDISADQFRIAHQGEVGGPGGDDLSALHAVKQAGDL